MELSPLPSWEGLRARLGATRHHAQHLMQLKPGRPVEELVRHAIKDLDAAERLLSPPEVADKPHILRAADVCIEVAQWRLRGAEQRIDDEGSP
jgi:hypothetical protein